MYISLTQVLEFDYVSTLRMSPEANPLPEAEVQALLEEMGAEKVRRESQSGASSALGTRTLIRSGMPDTFVSLWSFRVTTASTYPEREGLLVSHARRRKDRASIGETHVQGTKRPLAIRRTGKMTCRED